MSGGPTLEEVKVQLDSKCPGEVYRPKSRGQSILTTLLGYSTTDLWWSTNYLRSKEKRRVIFS